MSEIPEHAWLAAALRHWDYETVERVCIMTQDDEMTLDEAFAAIGKPEWRDACRRMATVMAAGRVPVR